MKANAPKNQQLIQQYPFLNEILKSALLKPLGPTPTSIDSLTIKVEVADGNLMYRQGENVGLGDGSLLFSRKGDRKDLVARQGEYLFAVDKAGKLINHLGWPRTDSEKRLDPYVYASEVLWAERGTTASGCKTLSGCIAEQVEHLVWVTVECWHEDTRLSDRDNPDARFGAYRERELAVIIYRKPPCGFAELMRNSNIHDNLRLHNSVITRAWKDKDPDLIELCGRLNELCQLFKEEVFDNGMREMYEKQTTRGASARFGSVLVMMADMCGRNRITIEDSASSVTFQGDEEEGTLFSLSVDGTLPQVRNLVKTVIRHWNADPVARESFVADNKVSVI